MKTKLLTFLFMLAVIGAFAQTGNMGIGTATPNADAKLDVTATNKGVLLPRVALTGSGTWLSTTGTPTDGMIVYNTATVTGAQAVTPGYYYWQGTGWMAFGGSSSSTSPSSGGTAVVSGYTCTGTDAGTLTVGTPATGVTHKITASVTTAGSYSIVVTTNGVSFSGSGSFALGSNTITLTATGTPTVSGTNTYNLPTVPTCSFTRIVNDLSTNGTGVVSAYNCAGTDVGSLIVGQAASGVTHTVTATVTTAGTYNITTAAVNGVTYAGTGTFAGTGSQTITLTASGTPAATGATTFNLSGTPTCSFTVTVGNASSGGTGVVSGYACNSGSTDVGTLFLGATVSGVSHTITATVTTVGTFNITATVNGVTYKGTGTFAGTGAQSIILNASGTPTTAGPNIFPLATTPTCSFTVTVVVPVASCFPSQAATAYGTAVANSLTWITRNLGANAIASSATSSNANESGCYFQFNRSQSFDWNSGGTVTPATPASTSLSENSNWLPANDPCTIQLGSPWRLPTQAEVQAAFTTFGITTDVNAFSSALKLHTSGRITPGSVTGGRGPSGYNISYMSTQASLTQGQEFAFFTAGNVTTTANDPKEFASPVRCVK